MVISSRIIKVTEDSLTGRRVGGLLTGVRDGAALGESLGIVLVPPTKPDGVTLGGESMGNSVDGRVLGLLDTFVVGLILGPGVGWRAKLDAGISAGACDGKELGFSIRSVDPCCEGSSVSPGPGGPFSSIGFVGNAVGEIVG